MHYPCATATDDPWCRGVDQSGSILNPPVSSDQDTIQARDARNNTTLVGADEIDQILPSTSSIMPSGLIDELTLREISDLMSYLGVLPSAEIASRP